MWLGHFALPLSVSAWRVYKHVRHMCVHPSAKRQGKGLSRSKVITRKPRVFVLGDAVWSQGWSLVDGVMQHVFCGLPCQGHVCAHLHAEWQRLGRSG